MGSCTATSHSFHCRAACGPLSSSWETLEILPVYRNFVFLDRYFQTPSLSPCLVIIILHAVPVHPTGLGSTRNWGSVVLAFCALVQCRPVIPMPLLMTESKFFFFFRWSSISVCGYTIFLHLLLLISWVDLMSTVNNATYSKLESIDILWHGGFYLPP
jgi:hypothetical protein